MKRSANYIISFAASYQTHIARSAKKSSPCTALTPFRRSALGAVAQSHDFQAKIGENPTTLSNWQRPGGSGGAQRLPIAQPSPLAPTAVVRSRSEHTKHHLAHSPPRPAWWWPSCWFRRAGTRPRELFMEVTAVRQPSSYRTTTTTTMALECCKTDHSAMVFT